MLTQCKIGGRFLKARTKQPAGLTLLEALLVLAILAVVMLSLFGLFNIMLKMLWENKARAGATQLANQKLEIVRNLPYEDVGTIGGLVAGTIPQSEQTERNGIAYSVYTNVVYVDDNFDGVVGGSPEDLYGNDYKKVLVRVGWESAFSGSPVDFYTDVAPRGLESNFDGGTFSLSIFDAGGLPIAGAEVRLVNNSLVPAVDMTTYSNDQGQLVLAGVPAGSNYQMTVSKSGYSTDATYETTSELPTPDPAHLVINAGRVTNFSFQIDKLSSMAIHTEDINGLPLGELSLAIRGRKIIGWNGLGEEVYKYDQEKTTDANGNVFLSNMEWDFYEIDSAGSGVWNISECDPAQPVELPPNEVKAVSLKLEPQAEHSLLVVVRDANGLPVAGADVRATNFFGYDNIISAGASGQAFFSPLEHATTTVMVTKDGYGNYHNELVVYGYTTEPVVLVTP